MNEELKAKWVAALRSGEYQQTKGTLHRDSEDKEVKAGKVCAGYCCLGVLQMVADGHIEANQVGIPSDEWAEEHSIDRYAMLIDSDGEVIDQWTLAQLNDCGYSFPEIADYIETGVKPSKVEEE